MKVELIATTQPLVHGLRAAEDLIVYCARVSNPANQLNTATGAKLLRYCIQHGHWSIFEQADMTVEIQTSRAIAAQILRHRSFSFQEFSQRYSDAPGIEPVELREQAQTNRQSSSRRIDDEVPNVQMRWALEQSQRIYQELLAAGVARECARMVLPLATSTTLYMKGSVRSWIHYLQVRMDEHTQMEHREIARMIKVIFTEQFPMIAAALEVEK